MLTTSKFTDISRSRPQPVSARRSHEPPHPPPGRPKGTPPRDGSRPCRRPVPGFIANARVPKANVTRRHIGRSNGAATIKFLRHAPLSNPLPSRSSPTGPQRSVSAILPAAPHPADPTRGASAAPAVCNITRCTSATRTAGRGNVPMSLVICRTGRCCAQDRTSLTIPALLIDSAPYICAELTGEDSVSTDATVLTREPASKVAAHPTVRHAAGPARRCRKRRRDDAGRLRPAESSGRRGRPAPQRPGYGRPASSVQSLATFGPSALPLAASPHVKPAPQRIHPEDPEAS